MANIIKNIEQGVKKVVGVAAYQFGGGDYGRNQRRIIAKTPEGQKFLEDFEKSPEGKLRRKIWNWTQSK